MVNMEVVNMKINETSSSVPGYHIYKHVWDTVFDEELRRVREPGPDTNRSN